MSYTFFKKSRMATPFVTPSLPGKRNPARMLVVPHKHLTPPLRSWLGKLIQSRSKIIFLPSAMR